MKKLKNGRLRRDPDWDDDLYVKVYEFARSGMTVREMAEALGIRVHKFYNWIKENPALAKAATTGRSPKGDSGEKFFEYVYKRLPAHLKVIWDALEQYEEDFSGDTPEEMIEALFHDRGIRARQHLWVHALVSSNFNASEACRRVNICGPTLTNWCADPGFAELVGALHTIKKDWIEEHLMKLVGRGDTAATIFAARTQLRDRGYNPRLDVHVSGGLEHLHAEVGVGDLEALPLEERRRVLAALRAGRNKKPKQLPQPAEDAEFTVKEKP